MTGERDDQTTTGLGRHVGSLHPPRHAPVTLPALTILCHPQLERVGERALLSELAAGRPALLSRQEPAFAPPPQTLGVALDDPHVSRRPVRLHPVDDAIRLVAQDSRTEVTIDGEPVAERTFSAAELGGGVVITLAHRIALLLHTVPVSPAVVSLGRASPSALGLVGHSAAILDVQDELRRVADLDVPILLRGETGTGKELVARAIHELGPRCDRPLVAVNLGAIPAALAAAELFGAARGAYTGAVRDQEGYFRRADRGTLFLDEIGEAPPDVQVMLLRALETGEIYPLGAQRPEHIDVRIIAATDADLEGKTRDGTFRLPLLHRLAGYEIRIPPLRERRDDIARLLVHFLRQEREKLGEPWPPVAGARPAAPWLAPEVVTRLVGHDWPGNVRQLRNVARQMVIAGHGKSEVMLTPQLERVIAMAPARAAGEPRTASPEPTGLRKPSEVGEDEMLAVLEAHRWDLAATARALRITRPSLYMLIERSGRVRTAGELGADEITRCHQELGGDLDEMSVHLRVSRSALRRRLHELGLR
jgi:two-component system nitrogen regulation response regulator GlnG